MAMFTATIGSSLTGLSSLSHHFSSDSSSSLSPLSSSIFLSNFPKFPLSKSLPRICSLKVSVSDTATSNGAVEEDPHEEHKELIQARRSADWKAARSYNDSGLIYEGTVESVNTGGLLIRFYSLLGFLPYSQLSPSHSCKEPNKPLHVVGKNLEGSPISVKIITADEEKRKLVFSERLASWSKYSEKISVGDIFDGRVGGVEDFGAFVHLRFPDGLYHLTGMVHSSEVSWDVVQDVRDVLRSGDDVRVKVIKIDKQKFRISLSIKLLEDDPLLQTLDRVIPQNRSATSDAVSSSDSADIAPLPGLETIIEELLQEDGIEDVHISRQGFEKRVVSQDLQLWLSNAPPVNQQFTLLARAGRQVQEILLSTSLDQEGIKRALQKVLERVP